MARFDFDGLKSIHQHDSAHIHTIISHLEAGKHIAYECSILDDSFCALKNALFEQESAKDFRLYRLNLLTIRTANSFMDVLGKVTAIENQSGVLKNLLKAMESEAKKARQTFVIWVDEAHAMDDFEDSKTFLAALGSELTESKNVLFCFAGSREQTMQKLFTKRNAPLAGTAVTVRYENTNTDALVPMIVEAFAKVDKKITPEAGQTIAAIAGGHVDIIRKLIWLIDLQTKKNVSVKKVRRAADDLVAVLAPAYTLQTAKLTAKQVNFLHAMATGLTRGFAAQENLTRFRLGNSANVARLKDSLLEKNIIHVTDTGLVQFTDPLYRYWLSVQFETQN